MPLTPFWPVRPHLTVMTRSMNVGSASLPERRKEVEIKLPVDGIAAMRRSLQRLGFSLHDRRRLEVNWLFDDAESRLRSQGLLLRLRKSGRDWLLTWKGPSVAGPHKSREESETPVSNGDEMRQILHGLGYRETFVYERYRTTFIQGTGARRGEAVIDETPIGTYLELEGTPAWIDRTAAALGFAPSQYILQSYARLFQQHVSEHQLKARNFTFAEVEAARRGEGDGHES